MCQEKEEGVNPVSLLVLLPQGGGGPECRVMAARGVGAHSAACIARGTSGRRCLAGRTMHALAKALQASTRPWYAAGDGCAGASESAH